jgi:hypothetical protein
MNMQAAFTLFNNTDGIGQPLLMTEVKNNNEIIGVIIATLSRSYCNFSPYSQGQT